MKTVKISKFRMRAFTCATCKIHIEVMGNDSLPTQCPNGHALNAKPDFDVLISTEKTTEPYPGE